MFLKSSAADYVVCGKGLTFIHVVTFPKFSTLSRLEQTETLQVNLFILDKTEKLAFSLYKFTLDVCFLES